MKPIEFEGHNVVFAKDQPEYNPLPAKRDEDGTVTTVWELSEEEKQLIASNGKICLRQLTFNKPLQPVHLSVVNSEKGESDGI